MSELTDKRALVCGASQGIGRACAEALARLGASVTVVARNMQALHNVVAGLDSSAGQVHESLAADFDDLPALRAAVENHVKTGGPYHILVNNTGGPLAGPLLDAEQADLLSGFGRHVLAFQSLVQVLVPGMKAAGYGRIINIISTSVIAPIPGLGVSNVTRGAVANWGRTLAGELAPFGITVNNVLPGYTDTPRLKSLLQRKADKLGTTLHAVEEQAKAAIPAGRFAAASELGAVVAFLASPAASYVSGVNLPVDGGRTAVQQ